jgi:hypothetical protein
LRGCSPAAQPLRNLIEGKKLFRQRIVVRKPLLDDAAMCSLDGGFQQRRFDALPQVVDQRQTLLGGESGDFGFAQNGRGDSLLPKMA